MDATAIAITGLVTTLGAGLGGTWLGQKLQSKREDRDRRRAAYKDYIALALEMGERMAAGHDAARGRGNADLRPDFQRDHFRALALVRLVGPPDLVKLIEPIGAAVELYGDAIHADAARDLPTELTGLLGAIHAFESAASRDLTT